MNGMSLQQFLANWSLFQEAVLASLLAGGTVGMLGVFILARRMVFVAAALSQASGLGIAVALFIAGLISFPVPPILGGILAALACAVWLARPGERHGAGKDRLLGFVYLASGAGMLVVGSAIVQDLPDITSLLFGNSVAVTRADLESLAFVLLPILVLLTVALKGAVAVTLDAVGSSVRGLPVFLLEWLLVTSMALSISTATRTLGALPVFAFSVLPAMASLKVARRMEEAVFLALLLGALSGGMGYLAASFLGLPVGATQTLLAAATVPLSQVSALLARRSNRPLLGPLLLVPAVLVLSLSSAVLRRESHPETEAASRHPHTPMESSPKGASPETEHKTLERPVRNPENPWATDLEYRRYLNALVVAHLQEPEEIPALLQATFDQMGSDIHANCHLMHDLPLEDPVRYWSLSDDHARALGKEFREESLEVHHQIHDAVRDHELIVRIESLLKLYEQAYCWM